MTDWFHNTVIEAFEGVLVVGALMTALGVGLKRVYTMARGVEKILEFNKTEKEARESVARDLIHHIQGEDARDVIRDKQIAELVATVREISREVRPNGGSSMKDVVNSTNLVVHEMQTRVAVIEEWKRHEEREDAKT
jgi:hypothetical protein